MKKTLFIALLLFLTGVAQDIKATHNRGGEILYQRIAPFTQTINNAVVAMYNYSITVIKYQNFGTAIANRCVDTVYFGDGEKGVAPRVNGLACGDCANTTCGDIVTGPAGTQLLVSIYSITHTYAGSGVYFVRSVDPQRNQDIINIVNSVNLPFVIQSQIIVNAFIGPVSSPKPNTIPVCNATLNTCFIHQPFVSGADNDSLSYEITIPAQVPANLHSYPDPGNGGFFGMNAKTGELGWCNPVQIGVYALSYKIIQHRKNSSGIYSIIGFVQREMEVTAVNGIVGITEHEELNKTLIFPTPVLDHIVITNTGKLNTDLSYQIITLQGTEVRGGTFTNAEKENYVDCSFLAPGTYFIKIHSNETTMVKKIIKL